MAITYKLAYKLASRKIICYLILITIFVSHFVNCEQTVQLSESTPATGTAGTNESNYNGTTDNVSTTMGSISQSIRGNTSECSLNAVDPLIRNTVAQLLKEKVSLIEYRLSFLNYTSNPLTTNVSWLYSGEKWSRVTTSHGQTLLSLAFNYGVLSMMTLTFGTVKLDVTLADSPPGCLAIISDEKHRVDVVMGLLMRDFDSSSSPTVSSTFLADERICHEIIVDQNGDGFAEFRDRCCFRDLVVGVRDDVACSSDIGNFWLSLLYGILTTIRFLLLFFGPLVFIDVINNISPVTVPYVVKLREALVKTIVVCRTADELNEIPHHFRLRVDNNDKDKNKNKNKSESIPLVDLHSLDGFPKLIQASADERIVTGKPIRVRFQQYDINVDYQRTMTENLVEVGLFQTIVGSLFGCRLRYVGPFQTCCAANILTSCDRKQSSDETNKLQKPRRRRVPWIWFWRYVSNILLVILLPLPYYLRLMIYYVYEKNEVMRRKDAISKNGLRESLESSLVQYFTPTHPLFITVYLVYFLTTFLLAFSATQSRYEILRQVIYGSFKDLKFLDWTDTLETIVANLVWPFERFGALGCLVCIVYWPVVIPATLLIALVYVVPTFYLTMRMVFYSMTAVRFKKRRRKKIRRYQANAFIDRSVTWFRFDKHFPINSEPPTGEELDNEIDINVDVVDSKDHIRKMSLASFASSASSVVIKKTFSTIRLVAYISLAAVCILNLYSTMLILSEVVGCLVEIAVFTVMGVVVNASELLKYVMLVLMVFVHVCECFNGVEKKYLKLNKALFGEVKSRIRDLSEVTSLPSSLQENCGFKAQELNEQAAYESPDDLVERPARHWKINDLVLFVDSEDTPRIPKQLFNEVCNIRVAGVPGPVFRGQIEAIREVFKIGVFLGLVFLVVLSFSAVYKLSTTNQMLATVVGGFLPMILRTFVRPPAPDVELGTVSFKSKMDEVIKNFCQYWPIYDLPFQLVDDDVEQPASNEVGSVTTAMKSCDLSAETTKGLSDDVYNGNALHTSSWNESCAAVEHGDDLMTVVHLFPAPTTEPDNSYGRPYIEKWKNFVAGKRKSSLRRQLSSGITSSTRSSGPNKNRGGKTVSMNVDEWGKPPSQLNDRQEIDLVIYLPDPDKFNGWLDEWSDTQSEKLPV